MSIDYVKEKVLFWRENLRHPYHPLEDHIQFWPRNLTSYRYITSAVKCLTLHLHNLKELEKLKEKENKCEPMINFCRVCGVDFSCFAERWLGNILLKWGS